MGITAIEIKPLIDELNFFGPNSQHNNDSTSNIEEDNIKLKGSINVKLNKAVKIKSIVVKFKGESKVKASEYTIVTTPILPKLKTRVNCNKMLTGGEHSMDWELTIPNIYPRSFNNKYGSIGYKIEFKISSASINKKPLTASYPIILNRYILNPYHITSYKNNIITTTKFNYELQVPNVLFLEQENIPILIKYDETVKYIYTQFIQTEIYKSRNITKSEADMMVLLNNKKFYQEPIKPNAEVNLLKFYKRIQPVVLNTVFSEEDSELPLLLLQSLNKDVIIPDIESPLIRVYHQLEITFNFGKEFDEIRVKIPITVTTTVKDAVKDGNERGEYYSIKAQMHKLPLNVEIIDTTNKHTTYNNADEQVIKESLFLLNNEKLIKKSTSEQNLMQQQPTTVIVKKKQPNMDKELPNLPPLPPPKTPAATTPSTSLSPGTPSTPSVIMKINTKLANEQHYVESTSSPDNTSRSTTVMTPGLLPPPRRTRNKSMTDKSKKTSIVDHYVTADLPPIPAPPPITRQKLPNIPSVADRQEQRKTKIYYEDDDSDDGEFDFDNYSEDGYESFISQLHSSSIASSSIISDNCSSMTTL